MATSEKTKSSSSSSSSASTTDVATTTESDTPTGGDVDISELSTSPLEGEQPAVIIEGTWVTLDAGDPDVPSEYDGHLAVVLEAPMILHNSDEFSNRPYATNDPDRKLTVRTRDAANAILEVSIDAFLKTATERAELLPIG